MIDIGLNLLSWAMNSDMSLNKADSLVASCVGCSSPYGKLRWSEAQSPYPRTELIEMLAHAFEVGPEEMLCGLSESVNRLHCELSRCGDEHFHMNGVVFMDGGGSCTVRLSAAVDAPESTRMQFDYTFVDFLSSDERAVEASAHFFANGRWLVFDIDPRLAEHDLLWENIEVHPGFTAFSEGISLFEKGPLALAEHFRSSWIPGERPWVKEGGSVSAGIELYDHESLLPSYSARYGAVIGSEKYDILFAVDGKKRWEIRSVWENRFTFNVVWEDVDDVLLQLVVQNAYEAYDIARRVGDAMERCEEWIDIVFPSAKEGDASFKELGMSPDYDITTYRPYLRPIEPIHTNDFIVRSTVLTCGNPEHDIREAIAVVCVFKPDVGVTEVAVDAFCCPQCRRYYVLDSDFEKLRSKGEPLCRIITKSGKVKEFIPQESAKLSERSLLRSLGYNVNSKEDLSPAERRTILDFAISNSLLTKKATIRFLQGFIGFNGKGANMDQAVERWSSDIEYLMSDHDAEVERVKIERIFLTEKRW